MKEQIRQLRVEIDGLAQLCEGLKPYSNLKSGRILLSLNSDEILEAVKSLKLSKAWLGKVLERLGSENPYGSGYKTVEDIVPETDRAETVYGAMGVEGETPRLEAIDTFTLNGRIMNEYSRMSHIEKVDWLRTEVKSTLLKLQTIELLYDEAVAGDFTRVVEQHLTEARFWLGFEMGRIRDESK